MKEMKIADVTLCREESSFSFREKLEIVRLLDRLGVDAVDLPEIRNERADVLFVRTASSMMQGSVISVGAGMSEASVTAAAAALSGTKRPRIRIELPTSPVGMEYVCHKKPPKMLEWIGRVVGLAKERCRDVEFCAVDATRAEWDFLADALRTAAAAGATSVTVCDSAAEMLPDDFAAFVSRVADLVPLPIGVRCENKNGLAAASAVLSFRAGASLVKTDVSGTAVPLSSFATMLRSCGNHYGIEAGLRYTELNRIVEQIRRIAAHAEEKQTAREKSDGEDGVIRLDRKDNAESVMAAVARLGYDLSEEDRRKVYEEFKRVAERKTVGQRELEAIVASTALQVPETYRLQSYVINSGNIISATAQITLTREGRETAGVAIGDGPVDAAVRAIEQIVGCHYELDDFQIQSVTEGKGAMGSALVRLRHNGRIYSGRGVSTDIVDAGIRAYVSAVNKIVYEEVSE